MNLSYIYVYSFKELFSYPDCSFVWLVLRVHVRTTLLVAPLLEVASGLDSFVKEVAIFSLPAIWEEAADLSYFVLRDSRSLSGSLRVLLWLWLCEVVGLPVFDYPFFV